MVNNYNLFWKKWLLKYKSYQCLWDSSFETTPQERLLAWNKLIDMLKMVNKDANAIYLRECLQRYVCKYKLKAKKVEVARANGLEYEPAAFYYTIFRSIHEALQADLEIPESNETTEIEVYTDTSNSEKIRSDYERKLWPKVIERYISFKCLWDEDNEKSYTNKERFEAWKELLKLVKPHYDNADVEFLKEKFNSLRVSYRREVKRLAKAKENGRECEPKLMCFDLLTPIYQKNSRDVDKSNDDEDTESNNEVEFEGSKLNTSVLSEEKAAWFNILKKYVSSKCLWDHKKKYTNLEKFKAWLLLLKMVKETYPDANLRFLKKRISAYRTNYRRELNKINRLKAQGIKYSSYLFYMDLLAPIYQSDCESSDVEKEELASITSVDDELYAEFSENVGKNRELAKCTKDTKLWRKFVKKYVTFDCLWDNRFDFKRSEKSKAWQVLLKFVQSSYPAAHLDYIRKRIYILRSLFEKDQAKISTARENGIVLESTLYFYNLMKPMYDADGNTNKEYETDESTNDSKTDSNILELNAGEDAKCTAVKKELESLGFVCGPFETESLSHIQKGWLKFIKKYVSFKCLWDLKNRDDYTANERDVAWNELLGLVQRNIKSDADLTLLRNRVNTFRTNYLRSFKKAMEDKENGLEPDITLWYFNAISPIYQEGFPIILNENEDLQPEPTLNPQFTTYFPDDDNDKAESKHKSKVQVVNKVDDYILPNSSISSKILLQSDFSLIDAEEEDDPEEISKNLPVEECTDDDISLGEMEEPQMTDDEEPHVNPDEHFNAKKESPHQTQSAIKQKRSSKRKISQTSKSDDYENEKNCKVPKFDKYQTFETKIADHLDTMECEQYLLAEKLISDVCVYGRLGKLTIESGFKLKNY